MLLGFLALLIKELTNTNTLLLIHGHTHRSAVHNFTVDNNNAQRIVLGDWHKQGAWLKITPESMILLNKTFK